MSLVEDVAPTALAFVGAVTVSLAMGIAVASICRRFSDERRALKVAVAKKPCPACDQRQLVRDGKSGVVCLSCTAVYDAVWIVTPVVTSDGCERIAATVKLAQVPRPR